MNLRIVVRTNTPWSRMTMADFLAQKEPQKPTEFFRIGKRLIPIWEKATGLNFFQYRQHIKNECGKRLYETGIPISIGGFVDWDSEDEILFPIDDDDIFLPSLTSIASRFTDSINLVTWTRITNYLGKERKENPSFGGQLDTCNWGIRKSFLAQFTMSERIAILARHWHSAQLLSPKLGCKAINPQDLMGQAMAMLNPQTAGVKLKHPSILELEETHSVYFLHSASISFLTHKMARLKESETLDYIRGLPLHPLLEDHHVYNRAGNY